MSYYYQIGGKISDDKDASQEKNWRTADFERISKNQCINVKQTGMNKPGTKSMDRDDNEAMFVPQGYAVLGYDHDNCESSGRGVQFYHGYHESRASNQDAVNRVKAITGNKPGGIYNFKGPDGGRNEDQPRNIANKMSSWKVFDINTGDGLGGVFRALDEVDRSADGVVSANKRAYKRYLCQRVDKNTFDKTITDNDNDRKLAYEDVCENILTTNELKRVWSEDPPEDPEEPVIEYPVVEDPIVWEPSEPDFDLEPEEPEQGQEEETDWMLYGGIAAAVCSVIMMIIIAVVMKKKKMSVNV